MTENMKKFIEQASKDGALKVELDALSKEFSGKEQIAQNKDAIAQKTIKIAAKYGFTLTKEDFKAEPAELNEEQLKAVAGGAGGGGCGCVLGGYGGGMGKNGEGWCTCAGGGVGGDRNMDYFCMCPLAGGGVSSGKQ